jgi:hypothetical protein
MTNETTERCFHCAMLFYSWNAAKDYDEETTVCDRPLLDTARGVLTRPA